MDRRSTLSYPKALNHRNSLEPTPGLEPGTARLQVEVRCQLRHAGEASIVAAYHPGMIVLAHGTLIAGSEGAT